jgi:hypothetical protein
MPSRVRVRGYPPVLVFHHPWITEARLPLAQMYPYHLLAQR